MGNESSQQRRDDSSSSKGEEKTVRSPKSYHQTKSASSSKEKNEPAPPKHDASVKQAKEDPNKPPKESNGVSSNTSSNRNDSPKPHKIPQPTIIQPENPAKIKISKQDFFVHLGVGAILMVLFLRNLLMAEFRETSSPSELKNKRRTTASLLDSIEKMSSMQQASYYQRVDAPLPSNPYITNEGSIDSSKLSCALYVTDSSIPFVSGMGLFTAQAAAAKKEWAFQEGDIIIPPLSTNIPTELTFDNKTGDNDNDYDKVSQALLSSPSLWVHMKHHESLANVHFFFSKSTKTISWVASRPIAPGEELFINIHQQFDDIDDISQTVNTAVTKAIADAYHMLNPDVLPMDHYYDKVDDWSKAILEMIPNEKKSNIPSSSQKSNVKNYKRRKPRTPAHSSSSSSDVTLKPVIDATPFLQLIKNTILSEYDPVISSLLPSTRNEAYSMILAGGKRQYVSNLRPIDWIERHGSCVDNTLYQKIKEGVIEDSDLSMTVLAARDINEGDIVVTIPLRMIIDDMKDEWSKQSVRHCFGIEMNKGDSSINTPNGEKFTAFMCPTSFWPYTSLRKVTQDGSDERHCSNDNRNHQIDEEADAVYCPMNIVNAYFQWSQSNFWNTHSGNELTSPFVSMMKNALTSLTIDIIAKQDIKRGDEIIVDAALPDVTTL